MAKMVIRNIDTMLMHGVNTMDWYSSGLYCRTLFSV